MEWEVLQNVLAPPGSELQSEFGSFPPLVLRPPGVLLVQGGFACGGNQRVFPTSGVGLDEPGDPGQGSTSAPSPHVAREQRPARMHGVPCALPAPLSRSLALLAASPSSGMAPRE